MESLFKQVIYNQKNKLKLPDNCIDRDIYPEFDYWFNNDNRINIIMGLRRCGKSTLLKQHMLKLKSFIFINFDDERLLGFKSENFEELNEVAIGAYGASEYYFFDEIQNVPGFERFVRRLHDEGKKVVLTGSNSSLLSLELGTHLTGRYKAFNLYPFSFHEFLKLKKVKYEEVDFYVTEKKVELINYFTTWFEWGGLPEYLKNSDDEYVKTLYDNIIYRDIVARYGIRKISELKELVHMLASNISLPVTYSSMQKALQLSNTDTVKEYMGYLANSWMFFELHKYAHSIKAQLRSPRKVYLIDSAFNRLVGFTVSENAGRRLENLVYVFLKQKAVELFYYNNKNECDFVVKDSENKMNAYQVCYELNNSNRTREINGLLEAIDEFCLNRGIILTFNQEEKINVQNREILVLPVWKWMLQVIGQNL